jgi:membrane fusion protein (multidrug efflux system)
MRYMSILAICGLLIVCSCGKKTNEEQREVVYTATSPIQLDTLIDHEYVCQIHSHQHIELRALERGYLQKIYVDEGQKVTKGQLLFQIMPIINEAEVQKAKAEVSFVETEYQNTKRLSDSDIVSKNELSMARAKLDKAKAELSLAQAHLSFTKITAPFDGIIGRFNEVRLGSLVEEGDLLTTLSDNSKMWVYFNVPEAEYLDFVTRPEVKDPLKVKLQLANSQLFDETGIVETIEADFNNETGNIAFRATFQNKRRILRNGETGNILMPVKLTNAMMIPQKATFEILDRRYVYIIDKNQVVRSKEIKVGASLPHIYEVVSGLKKGDKILLDGIRNVKNGQKITYKYFEQRGIWKEMKSLHAE